MGSVILWRFSIVLTTFAAVVPAYLAYRNLTFPSNFAVISAAAAALAAHGYFLYWKEKKARFKVFYRAAQDFGTVVSFRNYAASFERAGTVFDAEFPKGKYSFQFIVRFSIPKVYEKFIIQRREILTRSIDGCLPVENSPLPGNFLICSRDAEFLLNLLKNRKILDELDSYPDQFLSRFVISFDEGYFEMEWTPPVSKQIDGFYQACRTAVVFHDQIKKLAEIKRR